MRAAKSDSRWNPDGSQIRQKDAEYWTRSPGHAAQDGVVAPHRREIRQSEAVALREPLWHYREIRRGRRRPKEVMLDRLTQLMNNTRRDPCRRWTRQNRRGTPHPKSMEGSQTDEGPEVV